MAGATRPFDAGRTGTANAVAAILLMLAGSTVLMGIITVQVLFFDEVGEGRFLRDNRSEEPTGPAAILPY